VPEVSETLAKLQIPPDLHSPLATTTSVVPLPRHAQAGTGQHQVALLIREGRRAAQQLVAGMGDVSRDSGSSKETSASPDSAVTMTSMSTALEKDFTVQGKKSLLACPFSPSPVDLNESREATERAEDVHDLTGTTVDLASPHASDPICAAMLEENTSAPAAAGSKCPIRFMDKHSPEEIAHYVETHKHEIPRSHEVCVRRYQRNEEQIRKLDAKYGSLVGMINDLSHLHRPMLPSAAAAQEDHEDLDTASNKRVENWAQTIGSSSDPEEAPELPVDEDRESHFDRPLRDVRLGESPSRPWGITVPFDVGPADDYLDGPMSPSPAPVRMHSPLRAPQEPNPEANAPPRKCPFDHTKMPFPSFAKPEGGSFNPGKTEPATSIIPEHTNLDTERQRQDPFTAARETIPKPQEVLREPAPLPPKPPLPAFINPGEIPLPAANAETKTTPYTSVPPQMVFNISGPVFIGYPMEQAMQFMQRFQGQQGQ